MRGAGERVDDAEADEELGLLLEDVGHDDAPIYDRECGQRIQLHNDCRTRAGAPLLTLLLTQLECMHPVCSIWGAGR